MIEARGGWNQEAEEATEEQAEKEAKAERVLFDESGYHNKYSIGFSIFDTKYNSPHRTLRRLQACRLVSASKCACAHALRSRRMVMRAPK